jgi:PAS domain-containing protein
VAVDAIQLQLSSALSRFATLHRRALNQPALPANLERTLAELERGLTELRLAQEHLVHQREGLETMRAELQAEREKYWQLFDGAPDAYIVSGSDSIILEANRAAAEMLNISQRFLAGKTLGIFVCKERGRFMSDTARLASAGGTAVWTLRLRPRERAPLDIVARVVVNVGSGDPLLHWVLRPAPAIPAATH